MAATGTETAKSRKFRVAGDGSNFVLDYWVVGASDEDAAWSAIASLVPTSYKGLPRSVFDFDPQGGGVWFVKTNFDPRNLVTKNTDLGGGSDKAGKDSGPKGGGGEGGPNPAGDVDPTRPVGRQIAFSTGGKTKRIFYSKEMIDGQRATDNIEADAPLGPAPDCIAIGFTRNGIAGTEVPAPAGSLNLNLQLIELQFGYFKFLYWAVGQVNKDVWNGFAAGEVMFMGADGHWVDGDSVSTGHTANPGYWDITFKFEVQANQKNVDIGWGINFPFVEGWDLVDVIYREEAVEMTGPDDVVMVQVPDLAYVQRIADRLDFFDFQIDDSIFAPE